MKWEYLREEEFTAAVEKAKYTCVMPVGCMEKHGQHLPLGTDTLAAARIVEMASEMEEVCVFPPFYFGDVQGYHAMDADVHRLHGAIALDGDLMICYLRALCDEIGRNGFKKIVLFNGHGGNTFLLHHLARTLEHDCRDYELFVYFIREPYPADMLEELQTVGREAYPAISDADIAEMQAYIAEGRSGGHACYAETAIMLGTYPELVRLDRADVESGLSTHRTDHISNAGFYYPPGWFANHPDAYAGHSPAKCSQAVGDMAAKICARRFAESLRVIKEDTVTLELNAERKLRANKQN